MNIVLGKEYDNLPKTDIIFQNFLALRRRGIGNFVWRSIKKGLTKSGSATGGADGAGGLGSAA
eukprot:scaffold28784_cov34-Prasinocladus_malaysianus.AAC.1